MFDLGDNPYERLGVPKDAQAAAIKSAYRKLALKCHPDKVTDLAQKAEKQEEFQKVQKAYETLISDDEREKYDDMVRANELEERNRRMRESAASSGRTPPRYDSDYHHQPRSFNVRTEPPSFARAQTFSAQSTPKTPYGKGTPPRSDENIYEERASRRRQDEEWESLRRREQLRKDQEAREREQQRDRERERERDRKEKDRRDKEKKKAGREKDRRQATDDKAARQTPYFEEPDSDDAGPRIVNAEPRKVDKKSKTSSSRTKTHEIPIRDGRPPTMDRDTKLQEEVQFAQSYLATSRGAAVPTLNRAQTYHPDAHIRHVTPPAAVPTPPPALSPNGPPPPRQAEIFVEEESSRRSSAKISGRRGSGDASRPRERVSSSQKKASSSREKIFEEPASVKKSHPMPMPTQSSSYPPPPPAPESPPKYGRSQPDTRYSSRPPQVGLNRSQTWYPGEEGRGERSRSRQARHYHSDDESDDDRRHHRHRGSRRTQSPEAKNSKMFTYRVDDTTNRTVPGRQRYPTDDSTPHRSYYTEEPNVGRNVDHRPGMYSHDSYGSSGGRSFSKVKTGKQYVPGDVAYGDYPAVY
jgi:curved DNA-binding protein CbpA